MGDQENRAPGADVERDGEVAIVQIRNPAQRNALGADVRRALEAAFETLLAPADPCRAIVLTGAGGTFSAGGNIATMERMSAFAGRERMVAGHRITRMLATAEKPLVAAVEKYAFGAGFSLALLCDRIVAARDASFCASFARLGLVPDMGLFWSLPQRVGIGLARRLTMLAEVLPAEEAYRAGVVDELAEPGGALAAAIAVARSYAAAAPLPNRLNRAVMARLPLPYAEALAHEAQGQGLLFGSEDAREGLAAFFEKRAPRFAGR